VRIPAGRFMMGSTEKERADADPLRRENPNVLKDVLKAEGPQHEVEITKLFWLGIHEVTQKQFNDIMGYNPSYFSRDGEGKTGLK
jgi:formylglycine-generating enzyme required for sulfatase activity